MIHELADVKTQYIGNGTDIWQFVVILSGAKIGDNCNINCHVLIESEVIIGDNVTVKSGVQLWDGIRIEHDVFIGPNVTFTNDKYPKSKQYPEEFQTITIKEKASIGAGATILGGIKIGESALVGAGALVTNNVPARALVVGCPARVVGWLNTDGTKMKKKGDHYIDKNGIKWTVNENSLVRL